MQINVSVWLTLSFGKSFTQTGRFALQMHVCHELTSPTLSRFTFAPALLFCIEDFFSFLVHKCSRQPPSGYCNRKQPPEDCVVFVWSNYFTVQWLPEDGINTEIIEGIGPHRSCLWLILSPIRIHTPFIFLMWTFVWINDTHRYFFVCVRNLSTLAIADFVYVRLNWGGDSTVHWGLPFVPNEGVFFLIPVEWSYASAINIALEERSGVALSETFTSVSRSGSKINKSS